MGRQVNDLKISGTFDGLSFYHHKVYGALVRRKTGPAGKQVKEGANFENTRRQNAEFGNVSSDNKLLRRGLKKLLQKESTLVNRLQTALWNVLRSDLQSDWGERTVAKALQVPEAKKKLEGYEFITHHAFMDQLDVQVKDSNVYLRWKAKEGKANSKLCVAVTVSRLAVDFLRRTTMLKSHPVIFYSRSGTAKELSIPVPLTTKESQFDFIVLRVQQAHKLKNEVFLKDDADCSLSILKVLDGVDRKV